MASFTRALPNVLTAVRFAGGPAAAFFLYSRCSFPNPAAVYVWTVVAFLLLAATNWLDGFLARRLNACTRFGAFFDPLADKVFVWSFLGMFFVDADFLFPRATWVAIAGILIFDSISTAARIVLWLYPATRRTMEADIFGKCKTALLYGSIFCALAVIALVGISARLPDLTGFFPLELLVFLSWLLPFFALVFSVASFATSALHTFRAH